MMKNFNKFYKSRRKERISKSGSYHDKRYFSRECNCYNCKRVEGKRESPSQDRTRILPMSVRPHTKEKKIHPKEVGEKNHLQEREGVEMIVMNEEPLTEARIEKGRTSHQGATQNEDIKLMLVNGYPILTLTTTPREVITPTPNILKMKVLPV